MTQYKIHMILIWIKRLISSWLPKNFVRKRVLLFWLSCNIASWNLIRFTWTGIKLKRSVMTIVILNIIEVCLYKLLNMSQYISLFHRSQMCMIIYPEMKANKVEMRLVRSTCLQSIPILTKINWELYNYKTRSREILAFSWPCELVCNLTVAMITITHIHACEHARAHTHTHTHTNTQWTHVGMRAHTHIHTHTHTHNNAKQRN